MSKKKVSGNRLILNKCRVFYETVPSPPVRCSAVDSFAITFRLIKNSELALSSVDTITRIMATTVFYTKLDYIDS
jgi:hypothetical protein